MCWPAASFTSTSLSPVCGHQKIPRSVSASSRCFSIFPSKTEICLFFLIWAHAVARKSRTWIWALMRKPPLITGAVSFSTYTSDRMVCPVVVVPGSRWFKVSLRLMPNSDKCITLVWVRWRRKSLLLQDKHFACSTASITGERKRGGRRPAGLFSSVDCTEHGQERLWWGD